MIPVRAEHYLLPPWQDTQPGESRDHTFGTQHLRVQKLSGALQKIGDVRRLRGHTCGIAIVFFVGGAK